MSLKNVIKYNNFCTPKKKEEKDSKRKFDVEKFFQKKYAKNNKSCKNYQCNHSNDFLNNNSTSNKNNKDLIPVKESYDFSNRKNHIPADESIDMNSIFAYDIEAENNIGKYKEKIFNRLKIVEKNYKNLRNYQNNRYKNINNINIRSSDNNNNNNNNSKSITPMNMIYKNNCKRIIPYKINLNKKADKTILRNCCVDHKSVKSKSTDISKNNYRLSKSYDYGQFPAMIKNNRRIYMGKQRTDITGNLLFNIIQDNNKNGFFDYCKKKYQISLENKKMLEEKLNDKINSLLKSLIKEQKEMKIKNLFYNNLYSKKMINLLNSKINYKNLLDDQINRNLNYKLLNENLSFNDIVQNKNYLNNNNNISIRDFLNKNKYVEINPYNNKKYYLGDSSLPNNTILSPQIQYKINKYIFPKNY